MLHAGVGIFVLNGYNEIIVGKRGPGCRRGKGLYGLPGGIIENDETLEQCIVREVREETGLIVEAISHNKHRLDYVIGCSQFEDNLCFWCLAHCLEDDRPKLANLEPDKCLGWHWMKPKVLYSLLDKTCPYQSEWIPYHEWIVMLHAAGIPMDYLVD